MTSGVTPTVLLRFTDGEERSFAVPRGMTLLEAARAEGVPVASQCGSGSCGTCLVTLEAGTTESVSGKLTALLPSEYAAGDRLACSTYAMDDAVFRVPYGITGLADVETRVVSAQMTQLEWLSKSVVMLSIRLPDGVGMEFEAGQYVRLRVPGTDQWRSYSMASTQRELPSMSFLIKCIDDGVMSTFLTRTAAIGGAIDLEGPFGRFTLGEPAQHYLMLAGGTGLAPIMSMLDALRVRRGPRPKRIVLCFACQTEHDLFFVEELGLRQSWMKNLEVRIAVTAPLDPGYSGCVGTPLSLVRPEDLVDGMVVRLCGPPGMIEAAKAMLIDAGVPSSAISSELFVASSE